MKGFNGCSAEEWDGTGLPPVGTVCEFHWECDWFASEVIAYHGNEVVVYIEDRNIYESSASASAFRPLKTEAERERDQAVSDISADLFGLLNMGDSVATAVAEGLYDLGYRKQGGE